MRANAEDGAAESSAANLVVSERGACIGLRTYAGSFGHKREATWLGRMRESSSANMYVTGAHQSVDQFGPTRVAGKLENLAALPTNQEAGLPNG